MNAQEIVLALRAQGWRQQAIAKRVRLSQGAISHIQKGRGKDVMASTYARLLKLYESLPNMPSNTQ